MTTTHACRPAAPRPRVEALVSGAHLRLRVVSFERFDLLHQLGRFGVFLVARFPVGVRKLVRLLHEPVVLPFQFRLLVTEKSEHRSVSRGCDTLEW